MKVTVGNRDFRDPDSLVIRYIQGISRGVVCKVLRC